MKDNEGSNDEGTETHDDAEAKAEAIERIRKAARQLKESSSNGKNLERMKGRRIPLYFKGLNGSAKLLGSKKFLKDILSEEKAEFLCINAKGDDLGGLRIFVGCSHSAVSQRALLEAELMASGHLFVPDEPVHKEAVLYSAGLVELPGGGFGTPAEFREAFSGADAPSQQ